MNAITHGINVNVTPLNRGLAAHEAIAFQEATLSRQEIIREELTNLCSLALRVRSWWAAYEGDIRSTNPQASYQINDLMSDLAIFSLSIKRAAALDVPVDEIRNYAWRSTKQTITFAGGRA